jgi:hypothetical protein
MFQLLEAAVAVQFPPFPPFDFSQALTTLARR